MVVAPSQEVLEDYVLPKIQAFFKQRGLELNQAKTHIKHIDEGFDFLGFEIRRFGGKLLTKPAKDKVLSHLRRIRDFLRINRQAPTEFIIMKLNPIIRGWANYYRHSASKQTFNKVDHEVWKKLWRWARRRHRNKPAKWVKQRYFRDDGYWTFYANGMQLVRHDATPVTRFRKVAGRSSPFDPSLRAYWDRRHRSHLAKHIHQRDRLSLLNQQAGNCGFCHQALELDWLDNHHIISRLQGGSNRLDNRMLVHNWCHHAHHQRLRYKAKKA